MGSQSSRLSTPPDYRTISHLIRTTPRLASNASTVRGLPIVYMCFAYLAVVAGQRGPALRRYSVNACGLYGKGGHHTNTVARALGCRAWR